VCGTSINSEGALWQASLKPLQWNLSLKGLSELSTQYKKPPYEGQVLQYQWHHANTFLPLKEENLYITAKMTQKWLVPKCPL